MDGLGGGGAADGGRTVEARLWHGLRRLVKARRGMRAVHAQGRGEAVLTGCDHVFGLYREHAGQRLLLLANFTPSRRRCTSAVARDRGLSCAPDASVPDGRPLQVTGDFLMLEPYQFAWIGGYE